FALRLEADQSSFLVQNGGQAEPPAVFFASPIVSSRIQRSARLQSLVRHLFIREARVRLMVSTCSPISDAPGNDQSGPAGGQQGKEWNFLVVPLFVMLVALILYVFLGILGNPISSNLRKCEEARPFLETLYP